MPFIDEIGRFYSQWFVTGDVDVGEAISYAYDYTLVGLSLVVAVFASYTAFHLIARVGAAGSRRARLAWLAVSATAMGSGIWAMHFVAILAVVIPHDMGFEPGLTALSVVFAILGSGAAFHIVEKGTRVGGRGRWPCLLLGGLVLGAGIGTMHYTGMAAMKMAPWVRYDPALFALSVVVAVALSTLALWLLLGPAQRATAPVWLKGASAGIMGVSITAMHYTGMAATYFLPAVARCNPRPSSTAT